jgi:hypothetical protein
MGKSYIEEWDGYCAEIIHPVTQKNVYHVLGALFDSTTEKLIDLTFHPTENGTFIIGWNDGHSLEIGRTSFKFSNGEQFAESCKLDELAGIISNRPPRNSFKK